MSNITYPSTAALTWRSHINLSHVRSVTDVRTTSQGFSSQTRRWSSILFRHWAQIITIHQWRAGILITHYNLYNNGSMFFFLVSGFSSDAKYPNFPLMISNYMFSLVALSEKQSLKIRVAANKAKNVTKKSCFKIFCSSL